MMRIMESKSKVVMGKIKEKLKDKSLFISMDETTDSVVRPMCVVLAEPLDGTYLERLNLTLLCSSFLEATWTMTRCYCCSHMVLPTVSRQARA